jgi:hypothetical protein
MDLEALLFSDHGDLRGTPLPPYLDPNDPNA